MRIGGKDCGASSMLLGSGEASAKYSRRQPRTGTRFQKDTYKIAHSRLFPSLVPATVLHSPLFYDFRFQMYVMHAPLRAERCCCRRNHKECEGYARQLTSKYLCCRIIYRKLPPMIVCVVMKLVGRSDCLCPILL